MDDLAAVTRLKNGDIGGLSALVERYQVQAVRTAFLITGERAVAEDVVQATFLKIYQRIDQYDSARPFAPWFFRIVANAAIQAARKGLRSVSLESSLNIDDVTFADMLPDTAPNPEEYMEYGELKQAVREALNELTPEQRAVIVLRYFLGFTESELADELACPPGTVKWRLHAARKQLRALLHRFSVKQGES